MKSGSEIYRKVLLAEDQVRALRKLSKGSLRSLLLRLKRGKFYRSEPAGTIMGLAMVEVMERFVKPRKGGIL
jgi:hypothetical protein